MKYTVQKLATLAGITVRTLHHYDSIGLLKPIVKPSNGYRMYSDSEVKRLQQILFFRELAFSLEDIKRMMDAPDFNAVQALQDQKMLLTLKKERLARLISAIDKTIGAKGGENMSNDMLFNAFDEEKIKKLQDEAKKRWGNTEAWKQSQERMKNWTKEDYKRVVEGGEKWTKALAQLFTSGAKVDSDDVQAMIAQHYKGLRTFYEPNYEMYKGLGQLYVDDPRFTKYYDQHAEGLAVFMRDAMKYYTDTQEGK